MPPTNARVDGYIKAAAPFAKPNLVELRKRIYVACPDSRGGRKISQLEVWALTRG